MLEFSGVLVFQPLKVGVFPNCTGQHSDCPVGMNVSVLSSTGPQPLTNRPALASPPSHKVITLMPIGIGRGFLISFPRLHMNSVSLQVSLRQKYLLFWLVSEHQENTKVVNGFLENKMLAFPFGKQKQNHPNHH